MYQPKCCNDNCSDFQLYWLSVEVESGFWYKPALKRIEFMVVDNNNNFECFVPCLHDAYNFHEIVFTFVIGEC
jgi:hypothetical protein